MKTKKVKQYYRFLELIEQLENKDHNVIERIVSSDWKGKDVYIIKYI